MITEFDFRDEFLNIECYQFIVRIVCLLVYYDFELTPLIEARFQNYKQLYNIGTYQDLPLIFLVFSEIEQNLLHDLWAVYEPQVSDPEIVNIWEYP